MTGGKDLPADAAEVQRRIDAARDRFRRLMKEVGKVVVGNTDIVNDIYTCLLAGGHVLMEGVPGLGKTLIARTFSGCVGLSFARIQFTPDLMPADITGTHVIEETVDGKKRFRFRAGPIFAGVVLADEINRATPKTQSALLQAMQEGTVTVGNETYDLPEPFIVLATENPIEMEGTYPLPEAQLDRFMMKLKLEFPPEDVLVSILSKTTSGGGQEVERVISAEDVLEDRRLLNEVVVASPVARYAARVVCATHPGADGAPSEVERYVRYGASPRGGQALLWGAKVRALLDGRIQVDFSDVDDVALQALRHRIVLNFEGEAEGVEPDTIIAAVLKAVPRA